jgi:plasmid stabilization system protein ParE
VNYRLVIRPRADLDRTSHFLYLSDRNPGAALRFDAAIATALEKIQADPGVGARLTLPKVDHLQLRFYRPIGFEQYLIVFRVVEGTIYVSRIVHGSQDVESAELDG